MNASEMADLEATIAEKRAQREIHNQERIVAKQKASKLSAEIRELESRLPPKSTRHAIRMSVEPAQVKMRPRG